MPCPLIVREKPVVVLLDTDPETVAVTSLSLNSVDNGEIRSFVGDMYENLSTRQQHSRYTYYPLQSSVQFGKLRISEGWKKISKIQMGMILIRFHSTMFIENSEIGMLLESTMMNLNPTPSDVMLESRLGTHNTTESKSDSFGDNELTYFRYSSI